MAMNLEEEILALEKSAEEIVSAARQEAKKILGTFEQRRNRLREEVAARVESEKVRLREEYERKLRERMGELDREKRHSLASIEKIRSERIENCARAIVKKLITE
ncbi:MAG: hypothetical protein NTZ78_08700 [Candidatus Aureabacteria bacterium]|nr:hypothetical protein [Candidatus Auribacterota bacterium]